MTETQNPDGSIDASSLVGTWQLDPSATTVKLRTKAMWGLAKVSGSLTAVEGSGVVGQDGSVTGVLVIDASSIDTAQAKRDKHLRTADFFDVERYPTFTYTATAATLAAGGAVSIVGTFTAHGQARPLPLQGTLTAAADKITLTVEADLNRTNWGMGWTKMGAGVDNHVVVVAVFTRA